MYSKIVFIFLVALVTTVQSETEYTRNDYKHFFKDLGEALGIEKILDTVGLYFRTWIRIGQSYNWKKFDNDIAYLQKDLNLKKAFYFIHKMWWVGVAQCSVRAIEFCSQSQRILLRFLKEKCDHFLGREAALHPWNVMMQQNQQHISFLIFVYSLALSLIAIKLLSWWNFMVYLAFWFLVYSFGGPYTVFKGLLTVTAFVWFIGDLVLTYPFHAAVGIFTLFGMRYVWWFTTSLFGLFLPVRDSDHADGAPPSPSTNLNGGYRPRENRYRNENRDISILTSRIDGMERKTDILTDRLEQLSRAMDRFGQNVSEDELDGY